MEEKAFKVLFQSLNKNTTQKKGEACKGCGIYVKVCPEQFK